MLSRQSGATEGQIVPQPVSADPKERLSPSNAEYAKAKAQPLVATKGVPLGPLRDLLTASRTESVARENAEIAEDTRSSAEAQKS